MATLVGCNDCSIYNVIYITSDADASTEIAVSVADQGGPENRAGEVRDIAVAVIQI
jgi:hypothetical protein